MGAREAAQWREARGWRVQATHTALERESKQAIGSSGSWASHSMKAMKARQSEAVRGNQRQPKAIRASYSMKAMSEGWKRAGAVPSTVTLGAPCGPSATCMASRW